jgi:putative phosphoesterase
MRALVISDIHGNIDVLRALEARLGARLQQFDRIICLGDLVDYGPNPGEVIDWVRSHATHVVRGNHDHAVATGEPCRSAPAFIEASIATRSRLQRTLSREHLEYLRQLPLTDIVSVDGLELNLVHACPNDPLYAYMPPTRSDEEWTTALGSMRGHTVLIGHTHLAFVRPIGGGIVINPGSLGMPKDKNPDGSYAIVDRGSVQFCRIAYDSEPLISRLRALDLPRHVFEQLAVTFRTGT